MDNVEVETPEVESKKFGFTIIELIAVITGAWAVFFAYSTVKGKKKPTAE